MEFKDTKKLETVTESKKCPMLIGEELANMLNIQKDKELDNYALYKKFSNWFKVKGLVKLSFYFSKRADEERVHHDWIADRLRECNAKYEIPIPDSSEIKIENLLSPFEITLTKEIETTSAINSICKKSFEIGDYKITSWLLDKLIPEQHEEESLSLSVLNIAKNDEVDWLTKEDSILNLYKNYKIAPNESKFYK